MEILFEDDSLIVCIKPRGILSQQGETGHKNMIDELSAYCSCEIFPVHRLDKDTGGVMVYAKTKKAAAALSEQVAQRVMSKTYIAIAPVCSEYTAGFMEDLLFFDRQKNKSFAVKRERRGVKKALLEYEMKKTDGENGLYLVKLHTGRTHQIRVQFSSRGIPLLGDRKYGGAPNNHIALWSYEIGFVHPESGKRLTFSKSSDEECFISFC